MKGLLPQGDPLPSSPSFTTRRGSCTAVRSEACLMEGSTQLPVVGVTLSSQWVKKSRAVKPRSKQWWPSLGSEEKSTSLYPLAFTDVSLCWESFIRGPSKHLPGSFPVGGRELVFHICSQNKPKKRKLGDKVLGEKSRLNSSPYPPPISCQFFLKIPLIRDLFKKARLPGKITRVGKGKRQEKCYW